MSGAMLRGEANCGGHVTLLFTVDSNPTALLEQGSRGAGFSLATGCTVSAHWDADSNPSLPNLFHTTVLDVCREVGIDLPSDAGWTFVVEHELPFSQGFGLSAAGAVATALALQFAQGAEFSAEVRTNALRIAHVVERRLSTGLGDVSGLYVGGVELRRRPGFPAPIGPGSVHSWDASIPLLLAWRSAASHHTKEYIDNPDWKQSITSAGTAALKPLEVGEWTESRWPDLLFAADSFALESGLTSDSGRSELLKTASAVVQSCGLSDEIGAHPCMLGNSIVLLPLNLEKQLRHDWQHQLSLELVQTGMRCHPTEVASDPLLQ